MSISAMVWLIGALIMVMVVIPMGLFRIFRKTSDEQEPSVAEETEDSPEQKTRSQPTSIKRLRETQGQTLEKPSMADPGTLSFEQNFATIDIDQTNFAPSSENEPQQGTDGIGLRLTRRICPKCKESFITEEAVLTRPITAETWIETDLHRPLQNPDIRPSLIASCPSCFFTWWLDCFERLLISSIGHAHPESQDVVRLFARADKTGRALGAHPSTLGFLALHAAWAHREAKLGYGAWMEQALLELEAAIADPKWTGNRDYWHYICGDICRQLGLTERALGHFGRVLPVQADLSIELLSRQVMLTKSGIKAPNLLPPALVSEMFCNKKRTTALFPRF